MTEQLIFTTASLSPHATFSSFYPAENSSIIDYLKRFAQGQEEQFVYLWGNHRSGCSHLLQATCHMANEYQQSAMYLSFRQKQTLTPSVLEALEQMQCVCLDDIDAIAGDTNWEEALFHLYNRLRDSDVRLLVAAHNYVSAIPFQLADLCSRLTWGVALRLQQLNEQEKAAAIQFSAKQRGFELSDAVVKFLLNHCARDQASLFTILEHLDKASLVAKRKLTVPFVKSVLAIHTHRS